MTNKPAWNRWHECAKTFSDYDLRMIRTLVDEEAVEKTQQNWATCTTTDLTVVNYSELVSMWVSLIQAKLKFERSNSDSLYMPSTKKNVRITFQWFVAFCSSLDPVWNLKHTKLSENFRKCISRSKCSSRWKEHAGLIDRLQPVAYLGFV